MAFGQGVKTQCKVCNQFAPSDQFRLHHTYKMVVCPACFSGKTAQLEQKKNEEQKTPARPPGWDAEDDYLEKRSRIKKEEMRGVFTRVEGTNVVKYTCGNCKYPIKFDPAKNPFRACPYCNEEIPAAELRWYGFHGGGLLARRNLLWLASLRKHHDSIAPCN